MGAADVKEIIIPSGIKTIDGNAFKACSALTSIAIPDSVTEIGDSSFAGCRSLVEMTLPFPQSSHLSVDYNYITLYQCL